MRSDHLVVTVSPSIPTKPQRKYVSFRDTRDHNKINMESKLKAFDWGSVISTDPEESVQLLNSRLYAMFHESFPLIRVKVSSRDPPYMSPLVKHLCKIRNRTAHRGSHVENLILQEKIDTLIRMNQVNAVNNERKKHSRGAKGWWETANRITGRKSQGSLVSSEYYLQMSSTHIFSPLIRIAPMKLLSLLKYLLELAFQLWMKMLLENC